MTRIGFIGLGDMGLPMARNLIQGGFEVTGFDLRAERLVELERAGGRRAASTRAVGERADAVFVMVLNGEQVKAAVLGSDQGEDGLLAGMRPGTTLIVSATIEPGVVKALEAPVRARGVELIDTPVTGGRHGAEAGTLTLMAAARADVLDAHRDVLGAVAGKVFHVGEEIGLGQTVKAALQAIIGTTLAATCEALVLGVKAGARADVLQDVFGASSVASPFLVNAIKPIVERRFKGTGSQITTLHKDVGITMSLARASGVAMFTTAAANELLQATIAMFPDEDNWSAVKLLEQVAAVEVAK